MKFAEETNALGVRPVSQVEDRRPGEESNAMGKLVLLIDLSFSINFLREARFVRALEHSEVGSGSSDTVLKRLDSIIDALRRKRFVCAFEKNGYS